MKKITIFLVFIFLDLLVFSGEELPCRFRYSYKVNSINKGSYSGSVIGSGNIYVPQSASSETVWSTTYSANIYFFAGTELNNQNNNSIADVRSIYAFVKWSNGGISCVKINNVTIYSENFTKSDINTSTLTGYDNDGRYFEFYL
jgi:hypothetical protein